MSCKWRSHVKRNFRFVVITERHFLRPQVLEAKSPHLENM